MSYQIEHPTQPWEPTATEREIERRMDELDVSALWDLLERNPRLMDEARCALHVMVLDGMDRSGRWPETAWHIGNQVRQAIEAEVAGESFERELCRIEYLEDRR